MAKLLINTRKNIVLKNLILWEFKTKN